MVTALVARLLSLRRFLLRAQAKAADRVKSILPESLAKSPTPAAAFAAIDKLELACPTITSQCPLFSLGRAKFS